MATDVWLPLYEGKMFGIYDHRAADVVKSATAIQRQNQPSALTDLEHKDPHRLVEPLYWVPGDEVGLRVGSSEQNRGWFIAFRDVTSTTNERTLVPDLIPWSGVGHKAPLIVTEYTAAQCCGLLGCLSCLLLDYVARQKVGGTSLGFFIAKQLPVLSPETFTPVALDLIVPRVLELTYTAWDLQPFALDCGFDGPPYVWDEERRALIRAELDGIYAHLYGLNRDDFAYILDTFPIVKRKDEAAHGEYRTKRLCLEAYDYFAPETLLELDTEVKAIETGLRKLIVQTLGQSSDALPDNLRDKLIERQAEQLKGKATPAHASSLPMVLESAYLFDLQKIMCNGAIWPKFESQFGPKSELQHHFTRLGDLRNPLAHSRTMSEKARKDGETAVAWFQECLGP